MHDRTHFKVTCMHDRTHFKVTCMHDRTHFKVTCMHDRTHFEIFGVFYPPVFQNWWSDYWASLVYGPAGTFWLKDVEVCNTLTCLALLCMWKDGWLCFYVHGVACLCIIIAHWVWKPCLLCSASSKYMCMYISLFRPENHVIICCTFLLYSEISLHTKFWSLYAFPRQCFHNAVKWMYSQWWASVAVVQAW